jgi:hypothetical protein
LGTDGVEIVGVGSEGTEMVGGGTDGVEIVGVGIGRDGTDGTVGTVSAGLECGWMPSSNDTAKPSRIAQTPSRTVWLDRPPTRPPGRFGNPLQPPRMAAHTYPFLMKSIHAQTDSIRNRAEPS